MSGQPSALATTLMASGVFVGRSLRHSVRDAELLLMAITRPEAASGYGFVLLFLPYVSSAFVPADTLPSWLRGFAEHQPITPVIESIRALLLGGSPGGQGWAALAWSLGLLVVAAVGVAWLFPRRALRRAG